jgi:RNA polymerase sigma-70 factor (ECF subfamily)
MMIWPELFLAALASEESEVTARTERQPVLSEAAFHAFYRKTARPLWSYICRICGDPTLADDFLQEAYLRFLRVPSLERDESLMKAYLYKIATNLITDHWRQTAREQRWVVQSHSDESFREVPSPSAKDSTASVVLKQDFSRVFQQMKPMERALLWLAYVEGSEHREIASTLGVKEKSIRVLLFRARQKLARSLKRKGLDPGATL